MHNESTQDSDDKQPALRKPSWLKTRIASGEALFNIRRDLREKRLFTVCEEAHCPNISECWQENTATFMILGDTCTRGCRFCNVKTGSSHGVLDPNEALNTAQSVQKMELSYVVLTMVNRDDVADGGAAHARDVINKIKEISPLTKVEFLAGDFGGSDAALKTVLSAQPVVFAHNLETVESISRRVRDVRAGYRLSLSVLQNVKKLAHYPVLTKSSLMLGLGESQQEVLEAMQDLRQVHVDFLTLGQYMQPTAQHYPLKEYVHPDVFRSLGQAALDMGFRVVASAPLVRSSYRAEQFYKQCSHTDGLQLT